MNENCENCIQSKMYEELKDRVLRIEENSQATQMKLAEIEKTAALNEDRIKAVFNVLKEIKDSVKIISNKIDSLESKPGENWNDLIKTAITVIVTAAVTYFIKQ